MVNIFRNRLDRCKLAVLYRINKFKFKTTSDSLFLVFVFVIATQIDCMDTNIK